MRKIRRPIRRKGGRCDRYNPGRAEGAAKSGVRVTHCPAPSETRSARSSSKARSARKQIEKRRGEQRLRVGSAGGADPCKPGLGGIWCTACDEPEQYYSFVDAACFPCSEAMSSKSASVAVAFISRLRWTSASSRSDASDAFAIEVRRARRLARAPRDDGVGGPLAGRDAARLRKN